MQIHVLKCSRCLMIILCLLAGTIFPSWPNNVKVVGDIQIDPLQVSAAGVATIVFTVEWENSWRDDYNYDAVYFFFKYKTDKGIWRHAYLMDQGHSVGSGNDFEWKLAKSASSSKKNEGIFIQRKQKGSGRSVVKVELKWDIKSNELEPLSRDDFGRTVMWSGMGIEMVYIPRGAFHVGDNISEKCFRRSTVDFPAQYDIMSPKYYIYSKDPVNESYPPQNAVNKVNDISSSNSNAWVGNGTQYQEWMIDFCHGPDKETIVDGGKPKTIQYMAISGLPGSIPGHWRLEGSDNYMLSGNWRDLRAGEGTAADWDDALEQVYPPTKIIRLTNQNAYCYYRIVIDSMLPASNAPVIKTLAMTEEDLEKVLDYSVLIDAPITPLGGKYGITVADGDTWSDKTSADYPNGYKGFYVMKYEISQEQYVEFLNKLPYEAQKARTIGAVLDDLPLNAYVFGNDRNNPSQRNGIILASRDKEEGKPVTFACDLTKEGGAHSVDGDGQCIACNYLTIEDMLAYADWCGLRPLTEMEYEKMSRRPYPAKPEPGEFAWNSKDNFVFPSGLVNAGKKDEKLTTGNVNAGGFVEGPVRCGIFAGGGSKQAASGSSFWGVMDLCGNLSEMYYNLNTAGRKFKGHAGHGDGEISATGITDLTAYWPADIAAIGLRGGHYKSGKSELATSARGKARNYFNSVTQRDSTVSFRLGRTADEIRLSSILTAANGKTTQLGMVSDTICSGTDYRITGNSELNGATFYTYIWYRSENEGRTWKVIEGEDGKDLVARRLTNTGMADGARRNYWFKRKVITPEGDGESNVVAVSVVDDTYTIDRLRDTVTIFDEAHGIQVWTKNPTKFEWVVMSTGQKITPKQETSQYSYLLPSRAVFVGPNDKNLYGEKVVELRIDIAGTCVHNESVELFFPDAANTEVIGLVEHMNGYKMWSDGTFAHSAEEYRNPKAPYRYVGKTGSGIYRIDPDGPGPVEPFDVYCDMETDGGGWMLAGKFSNNDAKFWSQKKTNWTDKTTYGSATDITTKNDAKTPVWGNCPVNYMMFQNVGDIQRAFRTTQDKYPLAKMMDRETVTLSELFTELLAEFPNYSSRSCKMSLGITFLNSSRGNFPWINTGDYSGFWGNQISLAKSSSYSQGVISGYGCSYTGRADYGLGSFYNGAGFGSSGNSADLGSGTNASTSWNVLMFVK